MCSVAISPVRQLRIRTRSPTGAGWTTPKSSVTSMRGPSSTLPGSARCAANSGIVCAHPWATPPTKRSRRSLRTLPVDIGMAAELLQHDAKAPVALFDKIPGYPKGFRVLTNFFGSRRQNMTLGFSPDLNKIELSEAFLGDFKKISEKPLAYEVVATGPVMENVIEGDAMDVTRFPTPVWHDRDEGRRYIGTGSFNVTRDPDEGWVNAGTYRVMIHDGKRLGFYISPGKHGRIHRDKYAALNKPMPVCIVIGGDPLTFLMACTEVPFGVCEYEIAGAYPGRPPKGVLGKHTGF